MPYIYIKTEYKVIHLENYLFADTYDYENRGWNFNLPDGRKGIEVSYHRYKEWKDSNILLDIAE